MTVHVEKKEFSEFSNTLPEGCVGRTGARAAVTERSLNIGHLHIYAHHYTKV